MMFVIMKDLSTLQFIDCNIGLQTFGRENKQFCYFAPKKAKKNIFDEKKNNGKNLGTFFPTFGWSNVLRSFFFLSTKK